MSSYRIGQIKESLRQVRETHMEFSRKLKTESMKRARVKREYEDKIRDMDIYIESIRATLKQNRDTEKKLKEELKRLIEHQYTKPEI